MTRGLFKKSRNGRAIGAQPAGKPSPGLRRSLLKLLVGGPAVGGDQALWTLLLRDPPGDGRRRRGRR